MEKEAVKIRTMLDVWKNQISPKIVKVSPESTAGEIVGLFGGTAASNLKAYKPKNIIPKESIPGNEIFKKKNPSLEDITESSMDLEPHHFPSFQYHMNKGRSEYLGLKNKKIYMTKERIGQPIRDIIDTKEYGASKKLTDLLIGHHELYETQVKKPSMGSFMGHKSPLVIANENNILATLHKDNPGMKKSIDSLKDTMNNITEIDPARKFVAQYTGGQFGSQKIPKAMKKHIYRKYHAQAKEELGTE